MQEQSDNTPITVKAAAESGIKIGGTITEVLIALAQTSALQELGQELTNFLTNIGADWDDPDIAEMEVAELLRDARTLLKMGSRYGVLFYAIPYEEHRPTGRPPSQLYDVAFRWIASGRLSRDQARTLAYAMQGIDLDTLPEDKRKELESKFNAAMKRRKTPRT